MIKSATAGLAIFASIFLSVSCAQSQTRSADWDADLAFYQSELERRHIDLYHTLSREDFSKELQNIGNKAGKLPQSQTITSLMALTRKIGDGHTTLPLWDFASKTYPLEITAIEGQFWVTATREEDNILLASRITHINDIDIDTIASQMGEIVPFVENSHSRAVRIAAYLTHATVLEGIGVLEANAKNLSVSFENQAGENYNAAFNLIDPPETGSLTDIAIHFDNEEGLERVYEHSDRLWFGHHQETGAVYIRFRQYPSQADMENFGEQLSTHLGKHTDTPVIIDLRENYGGNFYMGLFMSAYLVSIDTIDWQDGVYVLTNGKTFSAAMSNTSQFKQILNARTIGQPTGASPCGYQDLGSFNLPNSKLMITYSKRRFCFETSSTHAIEPDVYVPITIKDYLDNTDPVLNWVYNDIRN